MLSVRGVRVRIVLWSLYFFVVLKVSETRCVVSFARYFCFLGLNYQLYFNVIECRVSHLKNTLEGE